MLKRKSQWLGLDFNGSAPDPNVELSHSPLLAGLAFKRKWQHKRKAEGKPYDKPNMVTGANVQVRRQKELFLDLAFHTDATG